MPGENLQEKSALSADEQNMYEKIMDWHANLGTAYLNSSPEDRREFEKKFTKTLNAPEEEQERLKASISEKLGDANLEGMESIEAILRLSGVEIDKKE